MDSTRVAAQTKIFCAAAITSARTPSLICDRKIDIELISFVAMMHSLNLSWFEGNNLRLRPRFLARPEEFDALMIPGGLFNPDALRSNNDALEFARHFSREGKPVAAICHGPQVLISADLVRGRKMTSWPAIQADMRNAGARWVDEEVVVDNGLVTSRKPDDIPTFNKKMIEEFCEGRHETMAGVSSAVLET